MIQYKKYLQHSFFKYALSIISILFFLIVLFLFINIKWLSVTRNRKNNEELSQKIDQYVSTYQDSLNAIAHDYRLINALKKPTVKELVEVNQLLYNLANSYPLNCNFVLFDHQGNIVSTNLFQGNKEIFLNSALYRTTLNKLSSVSPACFKTPSHLNYSNEQAGALAIGYPLLEQNQALGYLILDIHEKDLYREISKYPLDDVIITDRYNNLIFNLKRQPSDPLEKYPLQKYNLYDHKDNMQQSSLLHSDLILYTFITVESEKKLILYSLFFLVMAGVLMALLLFPMTLRITQKNLGAINELQKSVEEMGKGNMTYQLKSQVFEEFQHLNDTYRHMVTQREDLLRRNAELSERKKMMEISRLEEQFNPHFVFNVLETLRYEILIDPVKASDMIVSFANLMRYSVHYESAVVSLETDIQYINDYLSLQKTRYNRRLTYHIDIPPQLTTCKIPKLLLQPIVENSLVHGLKKKSTIHIDIIARDNHGLLTLTVLDNGHGIPQKQLHALRHSLNSDQIFQEHIGLYNSHRVVRLLYGFPYGLSIDSHLKTGTQVTLELPIQMEETSNHV